MNSRALLFTSLLAGCGLAFAPPARAQAAAATAPSALEVELRLEGGPLSPETVRLALEKELGVDVVLRTTPAPLRIAVGATRVTVTYASEREPLTRTVDLPRDPERAAEVVALLAGNLARDEAADLLDSLRARRAAAEAARAEAVAASARAAEARARPSAPRPQPPAPAAKPRAPARPALEPARFLNLSLFHPVALDSDSEKHRYELELGLAYGRIGGLDGVAFEIGVLDIEREASGFAYGLLWNTIGGPVSGFWGSAIYTRSGGHGCGFELSGLVGWRDGAIQGVQLAGLVARAESVEGVQWGGIVSLAERTEGLQAAGALNVTGNVEGVVAAGALNVVENVHGASLAAVNVAERVDGVQFGVVNVADEVNGAAIGLVSIAGNGRIQPIAYATNLAPVNLGVKFVAGYAYSELTAGVLGENAFTFGNGLGAHLQLSERFHLEPGVHYSELEGEAPAEATDGGYLHYRLRAGLRLSGAFEVFAGGGARHGIHGDDEGEVEPEFLGGIALF